MLPPLNPNNLTTNTKEFYASIQVSSGAKAEEINNRSSQTFAPIKLKVTRTDDPMVFLQYQGMQKSPRKIILRDAAYYAVRKRTVIHIK